MNPPAQTPASHPIAAVLSLDAALDPEVVGRKAASLARLAAAGLPVLPGVVLTTQVLRDAVARATVAGCGLDPATLAVPTEAADALAAAVRGWGDVPLAVRSSGTGEDGARASFAGLFETVLDVRGADRLAAAVLTCWRSAFAVRVASYAGADPSPGLAVLVQPMVPATSAGVAFTADPVTGARDRVLIDAVAGLGDRLVSGGVDPQRWTVPDAGPPTAVGDGTESALTPAQAVGIAALARRVEALHGAAQDVEWALSGQDLVLLQARPVTTTPGVAPGRSDVEPIPVPVEVPPGFWAREASHSSTPRRQLSRQVHANLTPALARVAADLGLLFETLDLREIGGWEYVQIVPLGGKEPPRLPEWAVRIASRVVPPVRARVRQAARAARADLPGELIRRWGAEWAGSLGADVAQCRDVDVHALDDQQLAAHLDRVMDLARHGTEVHFQLHGAVTLILGDLAFAGRDLLGWDDAEVLQLVSGTSHRSTEPSRALANLAEQARRNGPLRAAIEAGRPLQEVLDVDPRFAAAFGRYLHDYGCRALRYDVSEQALDERPDLVLALIRDQLATGYDPAEHEHSLAAARGEAAARARRALAERRPADRERFERALERALHAYPVREDNEFFTVSAPHALIRRAALEVGRRIAERGLISHPGDAFDLASGELRAGLLDGLLSDGGAVRETVRRRQGERAWVLAHPGPDSYGQPSPPRSTAGLPAPARRALESFLWATERIFGTEALATAGSRGGGGVLAGVAASAGTCTGPVRIVRDESQFDRIQPGDVLVCPITSPVWSVVFPSIGALVTDTGGILSHPAIIAREYGIPAVVATREGTTRLHDGQIVLVDGSAGLVQVLR